MQPTYDNQGFLVKVQERFAYGRDIQLTKFNGEIYLHIFDSSKCWNSQTKTYDKTKTKSVSLKWIHAKAMKECLLKFEELGNQMELEEHMGIPMSQQVGDLQEPFDDQENRQPVDILPESSVHLKQVNKATPLKIQGQHIKTVTQRRFQPYQH